MEKQMDQPAATAGEEELSGYVLMGARPDHGCHRPRSQESGRGLLQDLMRDKDP